MINNQISLRISGTKERKAGFAPLVMSGVLPQAEEIGLDRALTGCNGLGFVIKHTPGYSFYMAIDGKVRSFDAAAPGVLTIAFTIPAGMKFADEKTPYDLLSELHGLFVNEYMTESGDGRHVFQDTTVDAEPFKAILNRYSLEKNELPTITMNPAGPTGKLGVPNDKMQDFFKDSFYPEFKNFKDIEVGDGLPSSTSLSDIKIPRPIIYKVFVNGNFDREIDSTQLNDHILAQAKANSRYCFVAYKFTLKELIERGGVLVEDGTSVRLDRVNQRILCELKKIPIIYKVSVRFGNGTYEQRAQLISWLESGKISLIMAERGTQVNGRTINLSKEVVKGHLDLYYDDLSAYFYISPKEYDDYEISVKRGLTDTESHESSLDITLKRIERKVVVAPEKVTGITKPSDTVTATYPYDQKKLNTGKAGVEDKPKEISTQDKKIDTKMPLIFGLLLGLIIGFGIGFCIDRYLVPHMPSPAQEEAIRQQYREKFGEKVTDSIRSELRKNYFKNSGKETDSTDNPLPPLTDTEKKKEEPNPGNPSSPPKDNLNALKAQAVNYFNRNKQESFIKECDKDPKLAQFKEEGQQIFNILYPNSLNLKEKTNLARQGYLRKDSKGDFVRGDKVKIKKLEDLQSLKQQIEAAKQGK